MVETGPHFATSEPRTIYLGDVAGGGSRSTVSSKKKPAQGNHLAVGAPVLVAYNMQRLPAVIQFIGTTAFAEGEVVGVAFDTPAGKNDGAVMGQRYFQCAPNHGLFVRPRAVMPATTSIDGESRVQKSSKLPRKATQPPGSGGAGGSRSWNGDGLETAILPMGVEWVDSRSEVMAGATRNMQTGHGVNAAPDLSHEITWNASELAAGFESFWNALGTVGPDVKARAQRWCAANGAQTIEDVCRYELTEEFSEALLLKPVPALKAAEYFRNHCAYQRWRMGEAEQSTVSFVNDSRRTNVDDELQEVLQDVLRSGSESLACELSETWSDQLKTHRPKALDALHACCDDLKKVVSAAMQAKASTLDEADSSGRRVTAKLIAESEARLRTFVRESVSRLRAELSDTRSVGANFVPASGSNAQPQQNSKNLCSKSYAEAFEEVGGISSLKRWKEVSEQLQMISVDPALESQVVKLLPTTWEQQGRSTKVLQQRFFMDCESLLSEAQRASEGFFAKVNDLAVGSGGQASLRPQVPAEVAKLKAKWRHGDHDGDGIAWHRLTDIVNVVVVYPDIACMYRGLERAVREFKGKVHEFHDRYLRPWRSGYRELLLVVEHAGHLCQLHLNTSAMIEVEHSQGSCMDEMKEDIERAVSEGNLTGCLSLLGWNADQGTLAGALTASNAVHMAAKQGNAEIVSALLRSKADASAHDVVGDTPLHIAVRGSHDRAVWALIDQGCANCMRENTHGDSPLSLAAKVVKQQPDNERATMVLCTLAQCAGVERVREVVLQQKATKK